LKGKKYLVFVLRFLQARYLDMKITLTGGRLLTVEGLVHSCPSSTTRQEFS